MENLGMEVKDFEGAVKLQAAMMDKLSASRATDPEGKEKKEKKMTETQRAMLEAKIMQVNYNAGERFLWTLRISLYTHRLRKYPFIY